MARRAAAARTHHPCTAQDAPHRRAGQDDALTLCQELREVGVVEPGVACTGERDDLGPNRFRNGVGWPATAIPVRKRGSTLLPIRHQ